MRSGKRIGLRRVDYEATDWELDSGLQRV
jgi:hypothetical protein